MAVAAARAAMVVVVRSAKADQEGAGTGWRQIKRRIPSVAAYTRHPQRGVGNGLMQRLVRSLMTTG
jgi:hypothetical protein